MDYIQTQTAPPWGMLGYCHENDIYDFRVEHLAIREERRRISLGRITPHAHPVYHAVLYLEGNNHFTWRGGLHQCCPGSLVLASPGESHDFGPADSGFMAYQEITFSLTRRESFDNLRISFDNLLSGFFSMELPQVPGPVQVDDLSVRRLTSEAEVLLRALKTGSRHHACASMAASLAMWADALSGVRPSSQAGGVGLSAAVSLMERRFAERLTLVALSKAAGMSPAYFQRRFKERHGVPPIAYLCRTRVDAARVLLRTTGLTCKEIAALTGFGDDIQFSKMFRKIDGRTPASHRGIAMR